MPSSNDRALKILENFKTGNCSAEETIRLFTELAGKVESAETPDKESQTRDAILDISREARVGFPEAIYGAAKSPEQICEIFCRLFETTGKALATRCSAATTCACSSGFCSVKGVDSAVAASMAGLRMAIGPL